MKPIDEINENLIEDLLVESTTKIDDEGFTQRTLEKIQSEQARNRWIIRLALVAASLICVSFFPYFQLASLLEYPLATNISVATTVIVALLTPIVALLMIGEN